jgi:hypothetical protein
MNPEEEKIKKLFIEQLKKTPIVQVVCEKVGLPRATFYRWKNKNKKFSREVNESLSQGKKLINDMAESQLINKISEGHVTAIIYWLNHNNRNYFPKMELSGKVKTGKNELTKEQKELIKISLGHAFGSKITQQNNQQSGSGLP